MTIKINKNVPIPKSSYAGNSKRSMFYPIAREMQIGDQVVLPSRKEVTSLSFALKALRKGVATRKLPNNSGFGVWCVEPKNKPIRPAKPSMLDNVTATQLIELLKSQ
jgi:hypothetical protein